MLQSFQLTSLVILAAIATDVVFGAPATSAPDSDCSLLEKLIDTRYPLTDPIVLPDGSVKYRIAIISDLDKNSVSPSESFTWISYFKKGYLIYNPASKNISIEWDNPTSNGDQLKSHLSDKGRGSELSELVTYNANLITLDDKTGLVYLVRDNILIPWVMVSSGNGLTTKGINIHFTPRYPFNAKTLIIISKTIYKLLKIDLFLYNIKLLKTTIFPKKKIFIFLLL